MFSCYLKLERRQSMKKDGTESKTPRYEATAHAGYFRPLQALKNAKNEIVMYFQRNDKCNSNSTAETRLQCNGSINFSSVYLESLKLGEMIIGYGEPPQTKTFRNGKENPFYDNRADGYLFILSPDFTTIEILIIHNGRNLIRGYASRLADGGINGILSELRQSAKSL